MLLHEAAPPHTPCKAFCPSFLGNMVQVCCYTLHPFPTCFLTMFIMPSYCSPLSKVMLIHLHSVLLLSPLCYGFGFIPTTYKPQQTELFMLATTINFPSGNVGFKKTNIIISSKVKFLLYIYFYLLQKKKKIKTVSFAKHLQEHSSFACILLLHHVLCSSNLCLRNVHLHLQRIQCNSSLKPTWNLLELMQYVYS